MRITRLRECTFDEAVQVWNDGFQGYFSDVSMTMDSFVSRLSEVGISVDGSIVAWENERPVGFVLNAFGNVRGVKIAWNGGTGVAPAFRGSGVGRRMMAATLEVYRDRGVDVAYLEAIAHNEPAIGLYERMGYRIVDDLTFFTREGALSSEAFGDASCGTMEHARFGAEDDVDAFVVVTGLPQRVMQLPFYQAFASWQTQWRSVHGGQSLILFNRDEEPVAYALYKRSLNDAGEASAITLLQCGVRDGAVDRSGIIRRVLREVYGPYDLPCRRGTVNTPASHPELVQILREAGFTPRAQQVMMQLDMKG